MLHHYAFYFTLICSYQILSVETAQQTQQKHLFFLDFNTNIYSTNSVSSSKSSPKAAQHLPVNEEAFMKFKSTDMMTNVIQHKYYWKIFSKP